MEQCSSQSRRHLERKYNMFPGKVALQWSVCPQAFSYGWGQNKKVLARDTSPTMQATDIDPAAIPLQWISCALVTKSSPVLNLQTRLGIQDSPEEGILSMRIVATLTSASFTGRSLVSWVTPELPDSWPSVAIGQRKPWSTNYSPVFFISMK